jgi:DUF1009 family protein
VQIDPALDHPTIGTRTVEKCKRAGVRGIVICSEATVIANRTRTLQMINDYEMFLYAVPLQDVLAMYAQHFP